MSLHRVVDVIATFLETKSGKSTVQLYRCNHLNILSHWCNTWKIKINELKFTHITTTLRPKDCLKITFTNSVIRHSRETKYFGLILDRRFTWGTHLQSKRKQHACLQSIYYKVFGQLTPDGFADIGFFAPDIFRTRTIDTERLRLRLRLQWR
jgi:hypothetical protein